MATTDAKGALSAEQLAAFEEDGFLVVENVLDEPDLVALEAEYERLLDQIARRLFNAGALPSTFSELSFGRRYAQILELRPEIHHALNISLPLENGDIDAETFRMNAGPAVFDVLRNPKILDVVESVIGPEISCSPVQQMRMKPPQAHLSGGLREHSNVGVTTWHQDIVSLLPEADDTEQVTVWVAVSDATMENGCLVSVAGSHRRGPATHCANEKIASEPQIPGRLVAPAKPTPLPVGRGGVVLFHKLNIHRALPNRSDGMRWSLDLRYHPTGQPNGRPAFPGFVARSPARPESELRDPVAWARSWDEARERILNRRHQGPIFADTRWGDPAVC